MLRRAFRGRLCSMPVSLKAFISYSWTSPAFVERVRTLADRLRQDGIDVLLDQYDLGLGDDKFVYMQKSVSDPSVKKVIVLCDARYKEKFDNRQGGVGTESTMMTSDIYDQAGGNQTANNN